MTNTLIINPGSSNVKYRFYSNDKVVLDGVLEENINKIVSNVLNKTKKYKIDKVAYRVVYSGSYNNHVLITPTVLKNLRKTEKLDPTHMPFTIKLIEMFMKKIKAKHIACFDTVFHKTMPEVARIYAIPARLTKKYNIKRYGFHGLAHQYVAEQGMKRVGSNSKLITCQLGNGISITAIKNGKSIDTSMGFTPLEGVPMGTRSGNIDPTLVSYLSEKEKKSAKEIIRILNEESGLKGISGESDVSRLLKRKDKKAKLAIDMLVYNIRKYIGAYSAILGKVDLIVLGGGIARNRSIINRIVSGFKTKHLVVNTDEQEVMFRISKRF